MRNRISRLHPFQYLQRFNKILTDRFSGVYNPLNKLVRRIKDTMKTTEFLTASIMILIPLSIYLLLDSLHWTNLVGQIILLIVAIMFFSASIYLWQKVQSRIRKEESEEQQKRAREIGDMQILIREMKGLRQDIIGFLKNEEAKHTQSKATPSQSQRINR